MSYFITLDRQGDRHRRKDSYRQRVNGRNENNCR